MNSRQFAIKVVQSLQQAGYQALWAGGCVRDAQMGSEPKDYDVATVATPDQVREVFGNRRTLAIGAAFGVITVLGPQTADPIEIATFRRDGGYSDGRRPDKIEFTDAREDAQRRDFTINGMFFDPINDEVIDFVGGQADIQQKCIRAIGDANQRIEEDKLRMLRAVRFAATLGFEIEPATMDAVVANAPGINLVSGERIGAELRRMLAHPNRRSAVQLLRASGLLPELISNSERLVGDELAWDARLEALQRLEVQDFATSLSVWLDRLFEDEGVGPLFERWKLSNDERKRIEWILKHRETLANADELAWSQVQRSLLSPHVEFALAMLVAIEPQSSAVAFCRERLGWPVNELDPAPLLSGADLIELGITPGPDFKAILNRCRQMQLDGEIGTRTEAIEIAKRKV